MRREERVTVQGPVKKQQPDGMSHRGAGGGSTRGLCQVPLSKFKHASGPETSWTPITGGVWQMRLPCIVSGEGGLRAATLPQYCRPYHAMPYPAYASGPLAKLHRAREARRTTPFLGLPAKFPTAK